MSKNKVSTYETEHDGVEVKHKDWFLLCWAAYLSCTTSQPAVIPQFVNQSPDQSVDGRGNRAASRSLWTRGTCFQKAQQKQFGRGFKIADITAAAAMTQTQSILSSL